jgi:hypothetical protein
MSFNAVTYEVREIDGRPGVEVVASKYFKHPFMDDPHDDEVIVARLYPDVGLQDSRLDAIKGELAQELQQTIDTHLAGSIR